MVNVWDAWALPVRPCYVKSLSGLYKIDTNRQSKVTITIYAIVLTILELQHMLERIEYTSK